VEFLHTLTHTQTGMTHACVYGSSADKQTEVNNHSTDTQETKNLQLGESTPGKRESLSCKRDSLFRLQRACRLQNITSFIRCTLHIHCVRCIICAIFIRCVRYILGVVCVLTFATPSHISKAWKMWACRKQTIRLLGRYGLDFCHVYLTSTDDTQATVKCCVSLPQHTHHQESRSDMTDSSQRSLPDVTAHSL
jgi:hypothetical protein